MKNFMNSHTQKQTGAVLVMSLLMLFVLTLIGVSSINTTSLQEKMSGNTRNRHIAFQAAESAVRDAERFITDSINNPTAQFSDAGTSGLYNLGKGPSGTDAITYSWWKNTDGSDSSKIRKTFTSYASANEDVKSAPQYTIEYVGETEQDEASDGNIFGIQEESGAQGSIHAFRITVRGTGLTDNSVVVIQSHFGKRI